MQRPDSVQLLNMHLLVPRSEQAARPISPALARSGHSPHGQMVGVFDLLHTGALGLSEILTILEERRKRRERAILCGEPFCGAVMLGVAPPDWLLMWLQRASTVLCYGADATTLLGGLCSSLVPGRAAELHRAGRLLDAVLCAPRYGGLVVAVWRTRAVRIVGQLCCLEPFMPPKAAMENLDATEPRIKRENFMQELHLAHALAERNCAMAGAALNIRAAVLRILIETTTPLGRSVRLLAPFDKEGNSILDSVTLAKRYALAAAFARREAAYDCITYVNETIGQSIGELGVPDLRFVLVPDYDDPVTARCGQTASYIFESAETQFLAANNCETVHLSARHTIDNVVYPVSEDACDLSMSILEVLRLTQSSDEVLQAECRALGRSGASLSMERAHPPELVDAEQAEDAKEMCAALHAATAVLVFADANGHSLVTSRVLEALQRCSRTYPCRMRLSSFVHAYGKLSAEGAVPQTEVARDICSALDAKFGQASYALGPRHVLLTRAAKEQLDHELEYCTTSAEQLDALRLHASMAELRIQRAFHEEYSWLRVIKSRCDQPPRTPRTLYAPGCQVASPPRRPEAATDIETMLLAIFTAQMAAMKRDPHFSAGERWSSIVALRILRAFGWMDLRALMHCVEAVAKRSHDGIDRATRLIALAETAALVFMTAPPSVEIDELLPEIFSVAIDRAAAVCSQREGRFLAAFIRTGEGECTLSDALSKMCSPWMPLDYVSARFFAHVDVHCTNVAAEQGKLQPAQAVEQLERLHAVDDMRTLPSIRQLLNVRMAEDCRADAVSPRLAPNLSPRWVAAVSEGRQPNEAATLDPPPETYKHLNSLCAKLDHVALKVACTAPVPRDIYIAIFEPSI